MSSPTTLASRNNISIRPQIEAALVRASKATGVNFKYLVDTAVRESNLKTGAKSASSSATGLFQFIDETWLSTLKEFGPKFGLKRYSDAIVRTASGRHKVTSSARHKEILALRTNAEVSALMAGAYAGKSAAYLKQRLGREPRQGEVYIAHFLGLKGGGELIAAASQKPKVTGASMFPQAAKSNPSIFYDKRGKARTVLQVYYGLVSKHSTETASYHVQKPKLIRVPGQPLKLNEGLLKNLGRPMPVQDALIANTQYAKSTNRFRTITSRQASAQPQPVDVYKPTPWPVKPRQSQGQKLQFPAAGPGSLGYERSIVTAAKTDQNNGSLVRGDERPFGGGGKTAAALKTPVERTPLQISSKPTVLAAYPVSSGKGDRLIPANSPAEKIAKLGQIFVDTGGSFFTMRGKN